MQPNRRFPCDPVTQQREVLTVFDFNERHDFIKVDAL
jgi:hypothetical protein